MDAGSFIEADSRADAVGALAARLRRLQVDCGGPSVRDLERLTDKVGSPYTRGTIQDKLTGRSVAAWEFVEAFVRACALHAGAGGEPDLRPWREWHGQMLRELAARRAGRRRAISVEACPYRGLESFTCEHAEWFHGRGSAVHQVLAGLAAHRQGVLLLGPSGAGKSSLLQAGVLPALAAGELPGSDQWIMVLARPGQNVLAELDRAGLSGATSESIVAAVGRRLAGQPAGRRLLLVIDQFEELLTPLASDQEDAAQREVLDQLTAAIGTPALSVMLVLRDDFYPRLAAQAPELLQALTPGLVNVPATLNIQELRDIITKPAEAVGLACQDGLPERIITDVLAADPEAKRARHAPITVLPLLELTLHQLWQRRRDGCLTHEAYQRVGGVTGAMATWCDTAMEQLPPEQQPVAQRILTALVRPADDARRVPAVRQQVPLAALRDLADTTDPSVGSPPAGHAVDQVLAVLTAHRIVITRTARATEQPDDSSGVPVAELVHDALLRDWDVLREWVGQDHRFHDWLRRAGERHTRWADHHDPGDLLHGSDLAEGLEWLAQRRLPQATAEFLAASQQHQRAGIRRTRRLNTVLATLLVMAVATAGLAVHANHQAQAQTRLASSRQLAAQADRLVDHQPDLAILAGLESLSLARGQRPQPPAGLITGLIRVTHASRLLTGHTGSVHRVVFSPDGRLLATTSTDKTVRLWDVATGHLHGAPLTGHTNAVYGVAFSPDGKLLASASDDQTVRLWDVTTGHLHGPPLTGHTDAVNRVAFSPDGRLLATASTDRTVRLWEMPSGHPHGPPLTGHTNAVNAVAFSPDGGLLVSASTDHTVRLWDPATESGHGPPLTGHTDEVRGAAFSPDGRLLATAGMDHTVQLWNPGFTSWLETGCKLVNRNLSLTEWNQLAPDLPYERTCPDLPSGPDAPSNAPAARYQREQP